MSLKKNIGIYVNPLAGKGRALKLSELVMGWLSRDDIPFNVYKESWPAIDHQHTDIWIFGGDGTLNYFINHYPDIVLPMVIFKGGTGNDFAWKLYGDISTAAQYQLVLHTEQKTVDAGKCNQQLFLNGVGIGFDGAVLQSIKAIRFLGGHLGYLVVVIKKIFTFKEYHFKITTQSSVKQQTYLLVMVTNSSRTGGGFHVSPKADITDGWLNMVLCQPLQVLKRLKYLPVMEKGKHLELPFIHHSLEKHLTIEGTEDLPAQVDGELVYARSFTIDMHAARFRFVY